MKNKFFDNASELDVLIKDKEEKVNDLNKDIALKESKIKELTEKSESFDSNKNQVIDEVSLPKYIDYEDGNLLQNYKIIKERFNYDARKIISKFVLENEKSNVSLYEMCVKIRDYFTLNTIYKISSYSSTSQYQIIDELLEINEKVVLEKFNRNKFNLKKFLMNLDNLIIQNDPYIRVFVGNKDVSYDNINSYVKTIYDEKITEGFKIIYKGVMYDYSI